MNGVRGYDLIDQIKSALERACPRLVSCADIIAVATRDAVALARGMNYRVQTGRRDGFSSQARNVNLPGPSISVPSSIAFFGSKGFTARDMVLLIGGGHTVGITHCSFIQDRLFNFRNTGRPDPSMNPTLRNQLRGRCPQGSPFDNLINLDQTPGSSLVIDNGSYRQARAGRAIFEIDQSMASHPSTSGIVFSLANNGASFQTQFGAAMIKMGALQVLTGRSGEIRRTCRGGHTVGIAHCLFIQDRLFNFRNTGRPDPSMNPTLRNHLRGRSPQGSPIDNLINLDQTPCSSLVVDNGSYSQARAGRAIF
ncbi:hypothetical protein C5167_023950 [Papaver somniferum]|uniref:Peroxidase n=1 Tax=Papaver somniferum TaxID=3469 RepID=A0A4Y7JQV5_PAPSO|nr:hypothetical protein C5167_023950 [Papaver somniferum]